MFQLPDCLDWMFWGNGLMIGFPLVVVILSQLAFDLQRQGKTNLLTPLDLFRNSTLFLIFMTMLFGSSSDCRKIISPFASSTRRCRSR